uniref:Conotoxin Im11.9 n=1 Tax=Conus imperialis TaxID=35631 RepID=I2B9_CONIM|nr:RecName: Full=Conotoxin Im11.9; AltName: Full=Conopeptide im007; Flags: Precursor [Conus imperialis]AME17665.1 conopeptide im007 [Conus imperialis]DAZ86165.1 TPA_inf: conotoxin precursor I2 [Conus ebraeus]
MFRVTSVLLVIVLLNLVVLTNACHMDCSKMTCCSGICCFYCGRPMCPGTRRALLQRLVGHQR